MMMETRLLTRLGTLTQPDIFIKVAETRSITRAAEELFLGHSAVSVQVQVQVGKLADLKGLAANTTAPPPGKAYRESGLQGPLGNQ